MLTPESLARSVRLGDGAGGRAPAARSPGRPARPEVRGVDLQCPGVDVPLCREVVSLAAASWLDGANFGLGWGLVGPTGGSDSGEGREPLLPSAVGPKGRKRLA